MRVYTVHTHPDREPDAAVFVKEGFSWPGFIIPLLWMIYRRLWLALVVYVLAQATLAMAFYQGLVAEEFVTVGAVALQLLVGLEGNEWRRMKLEGKGFREDAVVAGTSGGEAEARYFANVYGRAA